MVRWPLQPVQPLQKTQLQPPFGPSVDSLCHPWFTTTNLSYRSPIFETSATALCGTTGKLLVVVRPCVTTLFGDAIQSVGGWPSKNPNFFSIIENGPTSKELNWTKYQNNWSISIILRFPLLRLFGHSITTIFLVPGIRATANLEKFIVVTDEAFDSYPLSTRCLQQGMVDL